MSDPPFTKQVLRDATPPNLPSDSAGREPPETARTPLRTVRGRSEARMRYPDSRGPARSRRPRPLPLRNSDTPRRSRSAFSIEEKCPRTGPRLVRICSAIRISSRREPGPSRPVWISRRRRAAICSGSVRKGSGPSAEAGRGTAGIRCRRWTVPRTEGSCRRLAISERPATGVRWNTFVRPEGRGRMEPRR